MPTYIFECYEDRGGCTHTFEVQASMAKISDIKPTCPSCKKRKSVGRNYIKENHQVRDVSPQTVGALADRNTNRMSDDEKTHLAHKNTKHRYKPYTGPLPEGATVMPRDSDGKRVVDTKQKKRDPRRRRSPS